MNRVKCVFENKSTHDTQRYIITIPEKAALMSDFAEYLLKNYLQCKNIQSIALFLDEFEIKQSEPISIIHPHDIISVLYDCSDEKKERKVKEKKKEKKEKKKEKKEEKKEEEKMNEELETTSITLQRKPVQDNSYCYPENTITIFDVEKDAVVDNNQYLRILPQQVYSGGNTNTPTVNAHKKTRRGKRGGRKQKIVDDEVVQVDEKPSFLDFIVSEEPSIIQNTSICLADEMTNQQSQTPRVLDESSIACAVESETSVIEKNDLQEEKEVIEEIKEKEVIEDEKLPCIGECISFPYLVLENFSPTMKEVKGVVKNITEEFIVVYSEDLDEIIKIGINEYLSQKTN